MSSESPRVSLCIPVRNGQDAMRRAIDSALGQDFRDLEVVLSDNASDDDTPSILREYAESDSRVRVSTNADNVGLLENVNIVLRLARGEFVRLLGCDDWLEPDFVSRCVEALEQRPEAAGVTTGFRMMLDGGDSVYEANPGRMPDSADPVERLACMLRFYRSSSSLYDPMHGVYRRSALERSGLLRLMTRADHLLTAELALVGPILHVPDCLTHRSQSFPKSGEAHLRRLHPTAWEGLELSALQKGSVLLEIVRSSGLTRTQVLRCLPWVAYFTYDCAVELYDTRFVEFRRRHNLTRSDARRLLRSASRRDS